MRKLIMFAFVFLAGQASAQYFDKMFYIGWVINTPVSNQAFADGVSPRGARLGYREMIGPKTAIGVDFTMATYDKYIPRDTYYSPGSAFTTDFTHIVNTWGATLSGEYMFREEQRLMPYAGLGVGVAYNNYKVFYNIYSDIDNAFGVLVRPRVGAWMRFSERRPWAINLSVHMEYSSAKSEQMGYKYFLNPGFEIGLVHFDW
jgi:opacity protein-like surface antigen